MTPNQALHATEFSPRESMSVNSPLWVRTDAPAWDKSGCATGDRRTYDTNGSTSSTKPKDSTRPIADPARTSDSLPLRTYGP